MSVAIATMGKFIPAAGSGQVVTQIIDRGSSGYGYEKHQPKPRVVVRRVEDDDKVAEIKITLLHVEEENA